MPSRAETGALPRPNRCIKKEYNNRQQNKRPRNDNKNEGMQIVMDEVNKASWNHGTVANDEDARKYICTNADLSPPRRVLWFGSDRTLVAYYMRTDGLIIHVTGWA
jgi:hypothetical protein